MEKLRKYLWEYNQISQDCWKVLREIIECETFSKDEMAIRQGAPFNKEVFIESGIVRAYFIDEQGNDKNVAFYEDGAFMSTNALRCRDGLSVYNYQALTDVKWLEFDSDSFFDLMERYSDLFNLAKKVKELEVDRLNKRDACLMQVSAEEKYDQFLKQYPEIENRIPHYHIASYLGITPVTLSRIRKK